MIPGGERGGRQRGQGLAWVPVAAAFATILVVCAALVWAMLERGRPGTGGRGGTGRGSGPLAEGDGPGSGESGDGPGAGAKGPGRGASGTGTEPGNAGASVAGPPARRPAPASPAPPQPAAAPPAAPPAAAAPVPPPPERSTAQAPRPAAPPAEWTPGFGPGAGAPPPADPDAGEGRSGTAGGGAAGTDPGARGQVSFTLIWSYTVPRQGIRNKGPDVDCWVVDPLGRKLSTSREAFELGPTPEGGTIDFDDMGGWSRDGRGGGPERVFWPDGGAPRGAYRYGVRWFKGIGKAAYTMTVYLDGKVHEVKQGTISESDARRGEIEVGRVEVR